MRNRYRLPTGDGSAMADQPSDKDLPLAEYCRCRDKFIEADKKRLVNVTGDDNDIKWR